MLGDIYLIEQALVLMASFSSVESGDEAKQLNELYIYRNSSSEEFSF